VQVALVHPYERRPCLEGPLELNLIMHLDDSGHAELSGDPVQPRQLFVVQQRNDEQHGVGTHDAGVVEVRRRDREILAQYGKPDRGAGQLQVLGASAEVGGVGQHRKTGRTAGLVRPGDICRIEIRGELALGRRSALDLSNE